MDAITSSPGARDGGPAPARAVAVGRSASIGVRRTEREGKAPGDSHQSCPTSTAAVVAGGRLKASHVTRRRARVVLERSVEAIKVERAGP
jgi:hypothetical protein